MDFLLPVELATKLSTKNIEEQIVRIERLIISFNKIITSLNKNAPDASRRRVQEIHFQLIENIIYHDTHLFIGESLHYFTEYFFEIKDKLDSKIIDLPLTGEEYARKFIPLVVALKAISKFFQKRVENRKFLIICLWCFSLGIIVPGVLIVFSRQVLGVDIWKYLMIVISKLLHFLT